MAEPSIRDFHAHIYYDPEEVDRAKQLAAATHQPILATDTHVGKGGEAQVVLVLPDDTAALTADQQAPQVASEQSRPVGTSGSELDKPVGTAGENEAAELPTTASP